MDFLIDIVLQGSLNTTIALMQRICVIMMIAYLTIRLPWLRQVLRGVQSCWQYISTTALFFGIFAVIGTHDGLIIDMTTGTILNWTTHNISEKLAKSQDIISFRDAMVLSAGLTGGMWVGLGAGLLSGFERYTLRYECTAKDKSECTFDFNDVISPIMTVLLGLVSGLIRHFFLHWTNTVKGTITVAFVLISIQHLILAIFIKFNIDNIYLVLKIIIPSLIVNWSGCLLFTLVMKDLERDRLRDEAQRAELRALHAQIEPHFLNNTLSSIQDLILSNPEKAQAYLAKLAVFFNETRKSASLIVITVEQELMQVQQYMDFQQLRFKEDIIFDITTIRPELFHYELPPCSLQTLVENALTHARHNLNRPLSITIIGIETMNTVMLHVRDNGCGIAPERLDLLTKQIVVSEHGSGTALYNLNQSLLLAFRGQAGLTIDSVVNKGTTIKINFPKELVRW